MISLRTFTIAAATVSFSLVASAQTPADHGAHHPNAADSTASSTMPMKDLSATMMVHMDEHMKLMRSTHEKMVQAKTPEERKALMAEHMKVMQDGMALMDGISAGGMMGAMNKGDMMSKSDMKNKPGVSAKGKGHMSGDMAMHHQMMETRMEMMQLMMQMMMDRMSQVPAS